MIKKNLKIGLTGGIASGKSTAAAAFASLGADIIDADIIAKALTEKSHPNLKKITNHFGDNYINYRGDLDRKALRELITHNEEANTWLKNLLHPQIYKTIMAQSAQSNAPYCILMIPLLSESHHDYQLDRICVVDCPKSLQLERLQQREGISSQEAVSLTQLQTSRQRRLKLADDIILNDKDQRHLEKQVTALHDYYLSLIRAQKQDN
jgi:dephospho-CoA kinase